MGNHLLAMKALRQKFGINENMTHVEKGLPEEVIPDLAEHLQAGIVVLGTVGRTGISAAFLGNTAEQVIDHLRCDLLVIKPDQYQHPLNWMTKKTINDSSITDKARVIGPYFYLLLFAAKEIIPNGIASNTVKTRL